MGNEVKMPNYITGPYAVGTETFSIVDHERTERLGPGEGPRKIYVRMYYPTSKDSVEGKEKAPIFTERTLQELQKTFHFKMPEGELPKADYYEGAEHVDGQKFPLVIYNHGYGAYAEANTFLCCELASNGYIVATVGHAYEAVANEYEDGSFDLMDKNINKFMYGNFFGYLRLVVAQTKLLKAKGTPEELYEKFDVFQKKYGSYMVERIEVWAQDTMCVVRELRTRYAQQVDFSKGIGATGHSLGGATAYYLCHHEEEISCGVNIDGSLFGNYEGMVMKKPFLQICCKENYPTMTRPLLGTEAFARCEVFEGMKHLGFCDAKFFIPVKMMVGKMDGTKMYKRLSACHFEVFDKYLK